MAKITQIAGRNALGTFAPDFAHFNDDILFGENWNNEDIAVSYTHLDVYKRQVDDELLDASQEFYEKHSSLYGIEELL